MKGIQFVIDDSGKRTAVLIDLQEWGHMWADFRDILVSESRKDESALSWDELKDTNEHEDVSVEVTT